MSDSKLLEKSELSIRRDFRYYSRKIFSSPSNRYYHEQRINAALLLKEKEPIQGALADFFYGCWYDIPYDVGEMFEQVKERLNPDVEQGFRNYIKKLDYIDRSSSLATRWSVLVMPSLNEQAKRLRISSDDAKGVARDIVLELLKARDLEDWDSIEQIENEFFSHCIAHTDRLTFTLVWFRLGKSDWNFNERWNSCQERLDQTKSLSPKSNHINKSII